VVLGAKAALAQAPSAAAFDDSATAAPIAPAPPGAAPGPAPADVVRLKNGGLLRGTISELIPGATVTIVTITGNARVLDMSEVAYAGPAAQDPQASPETAPPRQDSERPNQWQPQPYVTVHAAEARIQFRSVESGTTFYRRSGSAYSEVHFAWRSGSSYSKGYERICTAPCEASLPSGKETLAYGHDDGEPQELDSITLPPGNSQLQLRFENHPTRRTAGIVVIIAGPVLTLASLALLTNMACHQAGSPHDCSEADNYKSLGLVVLAVAGLGVGLGLGIPLLKTSRDTPVLETRPFDSAARQLQRAEGLTLSGKF
jgi:hypothetical protein